MTSRAPSRRRLVAAVVIAAGLPWLGPAPTSAQEAMSLQEHELEYQSALNNYQGAVAARDAAKSRVDRLINELLAARGTGDQDRVNQAWSAAMEADGELNRIRRRVESTLERLEEAGSEFLAALDDRRDELATRAENLPPDATTEAESLGILLRDLTNQIYEVDDELAEARDPLAPAPPAPITIEPDDGDEELRLKAQILEDRAMQYDSTLVEVDREIEQLQERQRNDRRVRDHLATLDRFDDRRLPVVPQRLETGEGSELGPEGEPSDTASARLQGMTLEDRIENFRSLRQRLTEYKNLVLEQARLIRQRMGSGELDWRLA